ncbi:hypothetical protein NMY22_g13160 [Coprinellus aureogranulatus]|nr:hypothetical protein NMY22_g13160 [Coprinellus aureogranulatus]
MGDDGGGRQEWDDASESDASGMGELIDYVIGVWRGVVGLVSTHGNKSSLDDNSQVEAIDSEKAKLATGSRVGVQTPLLEPVSRRQANGLEVLVDHFDSNVAAPGNKSVASFGGENLIPQMGADLGYVLCKTFKTKKEGEGSANTPTGGATPRAFITETPSSAANIRTPSDIIQSSVEIPGPHVYLTMNVDEYQNWTTVSHWKGQLDALYPLGTAEAAISAADAAPEEGRTADEASTEDQEDGDDEATVPRCLNDILARYLCDTFSSRTRLSRTAPGDE